MLRIKLSAGSQFSVSNHQIRGTTNRQCQCNLDRHIIKLKNLKCGVSTIITDDNTMKYFLLFLSIAIFSTTNAQAPGWQWAKRAGGVGDDVGQSISTDASGNVFVTGSFTSTVTTFGSTTLTHSIFTVYNDDLFVVKYDASGNVLWVKSAGGTGNDVGQSIFTDANGNVLVTGYFTSSSITFGTTTLTNTNGQSLFVVKYDAAGNVLWAKSAGRISSYGTGITADASGNVLVTGGFYSSSIIFGTTALTNTGSNTSDVFVVKYDTSGNVLWAKSAGGTGDDLGRSISTDTSGNILVTGDFYNVSITFGTTTLINTVHVYPSYNDIFVVKYDTSGSVLWAKSGGGTSQDYGLSISTDVSGNILVTGKSVSSSITFGSTTLNSASVYVVKYDGNGNLLWVKSAGGTDGGMGISTDANGNVFIVGNFASPSITFGATILTKTGISSAQDIYVVKYDPSGNVLWAKSAGGDSTEKGNGISTDDNGNIVITGSFGSASIIFGTDTLTGNYPNRFIYVAKICQIATPLISTSSSVTFCQGNSITLTASSAASYLWSNNSTTQSITVSSSGNYSLTINSGSNCSASSVAKNVTVNPLPTVTITPSGSTTFCQGDSVTLTASSANTYSWSNNTITQSATVLSSGNYTITVTDGNNCSATSSATIVTVNPLPNAIITANGIIPFCEGDSVRLTASSANSYLWSNGATTQSIIVPNPGNYFVAVTNSCGIDTSSATNVTINPLPNATITASGAITFCEGDSVTLTATSGMTSYHWSNNETTQNIKVLSSGNYSVKVINENGCSKTSAATTITVNPLPIATITASGAITFCQGDSVRLTATSGMNSYHWSNNETTQSITVLSSENDSVKVTNGNSCSKTSAAMAITVNPLPAATIAASGAITFCQGDSVTLTATSGMSSYHWSNNETTQSIIVLYSRNDTVTVTNGNGCSETSAAITVTVNPLPVTPTVISSGAVLTSSIVLGNQWYLNGNIITGATNQTYTTTQSGTYTAIVTVNGCSSGPSSQIIITVGISEINNNDNSFAIYPNPTNGIFVIEHPNTKATIEIYSVVGEKVFKSITTTSKSEIDLSSGPKGIYFIRLTQDDNIIKMDKLVITN
ncbi:MAG: SBBP repeat-containing protein [Bacteroidota bacterium]